jgi:hypothetical protein
MIHSSKCKQRLTNKLQRKLTLEGKYHRETVSYQHLLQEIGPILTNNQSQTSKTVKVKQERDLPLT